MLWIKILKISKIAPTVPYTYNKYNHKEILKEIGKLTNNEDKAKNGLKSGKIKLEKIKRNSK